MEGQQYGYAFDTIGNRKSATTNGRESSYTANAVNEYSARTVPGAVDILGEANPDATVTVNAEPASRQGAYFHRAVSVDNSVGPVAPAITTLGVRNNAGPNGEDAVTETTGRTFLPIANEVFIYDMDGNLISDGRFDYGWDAENRLVSITAKAATPIAAKVKVTCKYDNFHRRVGKAIASWDSAAGEYLSGDLYTFFYDGWNLAAGVKNGTVAQRYAWGLDLSGTLQRSGGTAGLIAISDPASGKVYCPTFDGSGNVTTLTQTDTDAIVAKYGYGTFGELLQQSGIHAMDTPFRFSTHYWDSETELLYAKNRFYKPSTGRWISRDPLENPGTAI